MPRYEGGVSSGNGNDCSTYTFFCAINEIFCPSYLNTNQEALKEDQGYEIKKVKKRAHLTRYSIVKGSGPRATFLFTQSEVDSLALVYNLFTDPTRYAQIDPSQPLPLQPPRNPFTEEVLSLIEKLVTTLPPEQKKHFERWIRKPYVYFNLSTVANYLCDVQDYLAAGVSLCFTC